MQLVKRFVLGPVRTNAFLIEHNKEIILVDAPPGCEKVIEFLKEHNLPLAKILLTHTHFDHIGGLKQLKVVYPEVEIYCPDDEIELLKNPNTTLSMGFGEDMSYQGSVIPTSKLKLDTVEINYIAGHSLNGAIYYFIEDKVIFAGDTLFRLSVGRSDFQFGNAEKLIEGIKKHILTKDGDVKVCPGHGFSTTVGKEIAENPFFNNN